MTKLCLLLFLPLIACQPSPPQTGHREIAIAVRTLLDKSYAGIDFSTYQTALKEVEAISAANLELTPHDLRDQVKQMLAYLRTAGEILRWQSERKTDNERKATDPAVVSWIERHPFLRAAVGAHREGVFDAATAVTLLWDKANEILRGLQVKSKPL